jgi:mRNA deadenylase 3'-5' endonuclease subunit Ccr4
LNINSNQAYPYCNTWSLAWPYRRAILQQEIEEAAGDIICLQEVQADHYEQHLVGFMAEKGYEGIFKQKTRESMGQYGKVLNYVYVKIYDFSCFLCRSMVAQRFGVVQNLLWLRTILSNSMNVQDTLLLI